MYCRQIRVDNDTPCLNESELYNINKDNNIQYDKDNME